MSSHNWAQDLTPFGFPQVPRPNLMKLHSGITAIWAGLQCQEGLKGLGTFEPKLMLLVEPKHRDVVCLELSRSLREPPLMVPRLFGLQDVP